MPYSTQRSGNILTTNHTWFITARDNRRACSAAMKPAEHSGIGTPPAGDVTARPRLAFAGMWYDAVALVDLHSVYQKQ